MPEQNRRYIITLASVAVAILVLGTLLRPGPVADEPLPPPPSQAELSRLTRLTQRRSLEAMKEYFGAVANDADRSVVRLRMLGRSGVVWAPGQVVTARLEPRFPPTTTITGDAGELGVPLAAGGPHLPIALLDVPETSEFIPVRRRSIENLDAGAWTVFVSDRHGAGFSPATYIEVAEVTCQGRRVRDVVTSVALGPELAGAGLFDLDNNLLGVVLPCDGRFVAVTADDVETLAREAETVRSRIAQGYGMTLDNVTPDEREHLGVAFGVLVRDVWSGELADAIGVRPGDIVISINAELILNVDQLAPLVDARARPAGGSAAADEAAEAASEIAVSDTADTADTAEGDTAEGDTGVEAYEVGVLRGGDTVVLNLPVDPLAFVAPDALVPDGGLVWDDPARGYRVDDVRPGTAAALAGLRPGDRLLRIDGATLETLTEVRAALSATRDTPVLLELERGPRRTVVLLP